MNSKLTRGFTLLEMMTVLVIIAILSALAMYNYSRYGFRSRRADGREMLMRVASAEERYFTNFNQYTTGVTTAATATPPGLGFSSGNSERGYYTITAAVGAGGQTFTLSAAVVTTSAQKGDSCGTLSVDNAGNKTWSGNTTNGPCW